MERRRKTEREVRRADDAGRWAKRAGLKGMASSAGLLGSVEGQPVRYGHPGPGGRWGGADAAEFTVWPRHVLPCLLRAVLPYFLLRGYIDLRSSELLIYFILIYFIFFQFTPH